MVDGLWLPDELVRRDSNKLRIGAVAQEIASAKNRGADIKAPDAIAERLDEARNVPAQNQRKPMRKERFDSALARVPINRIHAGSTGANQDFASRWPGDRNALEGERLSPAESVDPHCTHRVRHVA